ncbi:VrrA/YqfQ family protein [Sporolactobacillus terrae]|uniref:VrrA/YqfQ family protein n=1 Tax=Sporolactobacillus terrae TaxID=269673 RepID=UPI00111AD57C|nr:VrrA/YqfQ family protein [Sporolactobacillus terrae]
MPPFERGPQDPFFWTMQPPSEPPAEPARGFGFPPIFPVRQSQAPQMPMQPTPPPQSGNGGIGALLTSLLSAGAPTSNGATTGLNLGGILVNAQKAIQTAQTVLPMIQQFGPLIKNAPAIISAMKGIQGDSDKTDKDEDSSDDTPDHNEKAAGERKESESDPSKETVDKTDASDYGQAHKQKKKGIAKNRKSLEAKRKKHYKASLMNSETVTTKPSVPRMYI